MPNFRHALLAAGCIALLGATSHKVHAAEWLQGTPDEKADKLAEIQPGLGTVMLEYSFRFGTLYYAAQGGNWKLADYQMKEMLEIQEVGETTRPARAKPLKDFEEKFLNPLEAAIKAANLKDFNAKFAAAQTGCNECHTDQKFGFIHYELPKVSPSPLSNKP